MKQIADFEGAKSAVARGAAQIDHPHECSHFIPQCSPREWGIAIGIFLFTLLYLSPFLRFTILNADEGITLQGAQRILGGQVLYRDFFAFYTPGSYYWDALIFRLLGNSILAPRLILIAEAGLLSCLTYLLVRRTCRPAISIGAAVLTIMASLPLSFYVQHSWDSSALASLSVWSLVRLSERPTLLRSVWLGCFVALTTLFEQSRGAGLLLGLAIALLLLRLKKTEFQFRHTTLLGMAIGFLFPIGLTLAYFISKGALLIALKDWVWPVQHYSLTNRMPYGYIPFGIGQYEEILKAPLFWRFFFVYVGSSLFLLCALPIFGIGILVYLASKFGTNRPNQEHFIVVTCTVIGLWISVAVGRRDYQHFAYLLPVSSIFLAWILNGNVVPKSFRVLRSTLCLWTFSSFGLISFSMLLAANGAKDKIETRRGTLRTTGNDQVACYIQSHRKPGEHIFIYPYQPLYYYLTATSNPTRYEYLQPGLHSPDQIESAIHELETSPQAAVLFSTSFAEIVSIAWPSTPEAIIAKPDPMALYIVKHYRRCQSLTSTINGTWTWLYMVRMNTACPS